MLECCHQDMRVALFCIDNKYGLIEFTNFYQINHNFLYFFTKLSSIQLDSSAVADIDVRCRIIFEINLTQNLCKLTEKCFSHIIKEFLN